MIARFPAKADAIAATPISPAVDPATSIGDTVAGKTPALCSKRTKPVMGAAKIRLHSRLRFCFSPPYVQRVFQFLRRVLIKGLFWTILASGEVDQWSQRHLDHPCEVGSAARVVGEMIETDLPIYIFLVLFLITVFAGFVVAPYRIYAEEREVRLALEDLRSPKLHISIKETAGKYAYSGTTSQTAGGSRHTALQTRAENAVYFVVKNNSESRMEGLVAEIISAECVKGAEVGPLNILEPIQLPWAIESPEDSLSA